MSNKIQNRGRFTEMKVDAKPNGDQEIMGYKSLHRSFDGSKNAMDCDGWDHDENLKKTFALSSKICRK